MTKYKVVLVPFPFDDLSSAKVRPAVCLSELIGPHDHLILAFITSCIPASLLETDLVIDSRDSDFASTGLRVTSTLQLHRLMTATITSTLQLHRLMTATKSILLRELGELSPVMQAQVQEGLRRLFDLN
ncbi:MAG: type II toxin-antitoxin system PemK/MazF family toxin [Deltaproteobacteria bacterium]|nr:type II toxin-antitoxin system PemK/MazF family toxin [Deltaproteobacteria bacterium]